MVDMQRVGSERRRQMIAEAAYLRAEKRGFNGGDAVHDWMEAEREVDAHLQHARPRLSIEQLEAQLASANEKLKALSKKVEGMKADAHKEWQQDLDKLAKLRDTFEHRLRELREQGGQAAGKARQHAENVWHELSEALQRMRAHRG